MFKQKKSVDGRSYSAKYSHAVFGLSHEYYHDQKVIDYAYQINPVEEGYSYSYSRSSAIITNAIFLSDKSDNFAASVALGNVVGFDFTFKLLNETFLTGVLSGGRGLQGKAILQQRILNGNPIGLSVGATYGSNLHEVGLQGMDCGFCYASEEFYTKTAGLRFVLLTNSSSHYGSSRPFVHITGSANYDLDMKLFYPQVGFAFGLY